MTYTKYIHIYNCCVYTRSMLIIVKPGVGEISQLITWTTRSVGNLSFDTRGTQYQVPVYIILHMYTDNNKGGGGYIIWCITWASVDYLMLTQQGHSRYRGQGILMAPRNEKARGWDTINILVYFYVFGWILYLSAKGGERYTRSILRIVQTKRVLSIAIAERSPWMDQRCHAHRRGWTEGASCSGTAIRTWMPFAYYK